MIKRYVFIIVLFIFVFLLLTFPIFQSSSQVVEEDKGIFTISQYISNEWIEISALEYLVNYSTKNINVTNSDQVVIRIEETGLPFADIEQVSLTACENELIPVYARYVGTGVSVLDDILINDNNVIINHEMPVELSWDIPESCTEIPVLSLTANAYQSYEANAFSFPTNKNTFQTYVFKNDGSLIVDGAIDEVDGVKDPTFNPFWLAGTGHPSNYTDIYFLDDENYIYAAFDIRLDNTNEYGFDWLKVFVANSTTGETKEYRVDDFNNAYGYCSFGLTSKVTYKHQTCEIKIPKSEIAGNQIDFSIRYYGTAGGDGIPPAPSGFYPLSQSVVGVSSFGISFQTDINAICNLSLEDESYWDMSDNIICDDYYSTLHYCITPDLGESGEKNVYISCMDTLGDGDTTETNEDLVYSLNLTPVEIDTIEELDNVRNNMFLNYVLIKDLDFNQCSSYADCNNMSTYTEGLGWDPIEYWDDDLEAISPFDGVFDGQGHTISNLYINRILESDLGLFAWVGQTGEIKNLGLLDTTVIGGAQTGTIVGTLSGSLENSYSNGNVTSSGECAGGLVGLHYIEGESVMPQTILNSYSETFVSGNLYVGGLVGCNTGDVVNSYSTGAVTGNSYVGGLIGSFGGGNISNSYWDTDTSGTEASAEGLGLTTVEMQSLMTYSNTEWDIVEMNGFDPSEPFTWYINDGEDYPRLSWEYEAPEVLTKAVSNFTANGATLNGELVSMDGESSVSVSFRYRQGEGTWTDVNAITKTTTGVFSSSISGLTLNTQYSYQAVVSWREVGTVYGNIVSFTTPATPPLPTVFGPVVSNIDDMQTPSNTEAPLVLTKIDTGSITFPSGLDLVTNYNQLSTLSENLVIVYEPSPNRFRAYVNSNGASFLATHGAIIRFFNVRNQLGINGLTSSNFKTLLKVSVLDDSKLAVSDTSSYYNWNNASYNQDTDILTMPVNHFSEYVLGANTGVLPSTGMSSLTMLIPLGLSILGVGIVIVSKRKYKKI